MKKLIYIIIFMITLFIGYNWVKGVNFDFSGNGQGGSGSLTCNTCACGKTINIDRKFSTTAVYGVRMTIVDKNGNAKSKTVNFWASYDMLDYVKQLKSERPDMLRYIDGYEDYIYMNSSAKDLNKKYRLYYYDGKGLNKLDSGNTTYKKFLESINYEEFKYIFTKISNGNFSIEDVINRPSDDRYYLKAQPVFFVLFGQGYYNANSNVRSNKGGCNAFTPLLYEGTAQEITLSALNDPKYWAPHNVVSIPNGWNVIKNYFYTTYLDQNPSGAKFPIWTASNSGISTINDAVRSKSAEGLSVGYIDIYDKFKDKLGKLVITKNVQRNNGTAGLENYKACYKVYRDGKAISVGGQTVFCSPYPTNVTPWNSCGSSWDCQNRFEQIQLSNLSAGNYTIQEIYIPDDVNKVIFKGRTDQAGDYSIDLGTGTPKQGNRVLMRYAENTKSISVVGGKTTYVKVTNVIDDGGGEPEKGSVKVYKYEYIKDKVGYNFDDKKNYSDKAVFYLYKQDGTLVSYKTKYRYSNVITFNNLDYGTYYIVEKSISSNVKKVYFCKNSNCDDQVDVSSSTHIAKSGLFTVGSSSKTVIYNVYNETDEELKCAGKLEKIKHSDSCNGNVCMAAPTIINELFDLYFDSQDEGDFNKLLNYKIVGDGVDVSGVECKAVECSSDVTTSASCNKNNSVFSSFPLKTDNTIDNNIDRRVCYIGDDNTTHENIGGFYNSDIDAYCSLSYDFNLNFPNVKVTAGNLLWENYVNRISRPFSISVSCENSYKGIDEGTLKKRTFNINDYLPKIFVNVFSGGLNIKQQMSLIQNSSNINSISPIIYCNNSEITNSYCYVSWNGSFNFNLAYSYSWYLNEKGEFVESTSVSNAEKEKYFHVGYGFPIAVDEEEGDDYSAYVSIKTFDNNSFDFSCPYRVTREAITDDCPSGDCDINPDDRLIKYNFDIRIIDTKNPFPGVNGEGRLTGNNWCLSNRIGKKVKISDDDYRIVGDINNDYIIDNRDIQITADDYKSKGVIADINGDGDVTSNGCANNSDDFCILNNYINYMEKMNANMKEKAIEYNEQLCSSNNDIVKKYIIDRPNSSSTGKPMYSFTLNSTDIKNIREYNKSYIYSDYNYKCTEGKECIDEFLTKWIRDGLVNNGNPVSHRLNSENSRCYDTRSKGKWCNNF